MPIYLKSIGFTVFYIGLLEGLAEATAGLSKGYFGKLSDRSGRRVPFVQAGYALSAISKPMMALFLWPAWIFFARTIDRFGKGIRTGARDAILSDESTAQNKGKVFGFHRSMDTLGAVAGPALALIFLYYFPGDYQTLFYVAFLPGLLAVLSTLFLRERTRVNPVEKITVSFFSFINYWRESPARYRQVAGGLLVFMLFNSSDMFLLLKGKEAGLGDSVLIGAYIFYNLIYALFAFPLGIVADNIGLKSILLSGLGLFAFVYFGMTFDTNVYFYFALFFLYGIYAAATEGISKAWISNITDKKDTATAIGTFAGFQSICALIASSLTGLIWYGAGARTAFLVSSAMTLVVFFYFLFFVPGPGVHKKV
jgi:MFS family permease